MKHYLFMIGYWLVHSSGIFPLALKSPKKMAPRFSQGLRASWAPWTWSRRSLVFGIGQIFVILYSSTRWFRRRAYGLREFEWNRKYFQKLAIDVVMGGRASVTGLTILIAMVRYREIEQLLNNICSLYFAVFKHTDPPKIRRFSYLILYSIGFYLVNAMATMSLTDYSAQGVLMDLLWQLPFTFTLVYFEIGMAVILIYLQSAVEGLNSSIKREFPRVAEWDFKCWEAVSRREEGHRKVDLRKDAKSFIEEYRRTFREVGKIVDQVNSMIGFLLLILVIFNQITCQTFAFAHNSLYVTNSATNFVGEHYWQVASLLLGSAWCFVSVSWMCHSFEIVIRENREDAFHRLLACMVGVTTCYIASIDASEIDQDSKAELLEFLDEIDSTKIQFMAWNIFTLDYPTLYLLLTGSVMYMVIVIQYLSI